MTQRLLPRLRRRLKLSMGGRLPAYTADVSPGGFAAEVMRVPRPGTPVQGCVTIEGKELEFTGQVTWALLSEPRLGVRGKFGVRFTGIPNAFFEAFSRLMPQGT